MICQRCAKDTSDIHTCTPTALVRELEAQLAAMTKERDEREGLVCDQCIEGSGWCENAVEGRYACTCMTEAEPYQLLQAQLAAMTQDFTDYKRMTDLAYKSSEQETLDKLAASQAYAAQLRKALLLFRNEPMLEKLVALRRTAGYIAMDAALFLPQDDTALREALAKEREKVSAESSKLHKDLEAEKIAHAATGHALGGQCQGLSYNSNRYIWILNQAKITDFIFAYLKSGERHVSNAIDAAIREMK